jgi:ActR/RegA family two-component response regulator
MMSEKPQVLVVEDDAGTLSDYLLNLRSDEYHLTGACSLEEAFAALERQTFDAVVTDLELNHRPDGGMRVIERARSLDATTAVIMVTVHSSAIIAGQAIRGLGAQTFFPKPLDFRACRQRIHQAILERRYQLAVIEAADQGGFLPIPSPYMAGKPLGQGSLMFYGRDRVFDFIRDHIGEPPYHNHIALIGPRRIGKTSILRQFPERLEPSFFLPVYVNCQSLGIDPGMPAFFLQFARHIRRSLKRQGVDVAGLPALTPADLGDMPAFAFFYRFLPSLYQTLGTRSLVLCLDEFEELVQKVQRGRLDATVFGFLHSLMIDEPSIACVLAGTRCLTELGRVSRPAAAIVEMTTVHSVGPLSPDLARRLIAEPVAHSGMCYQPEAIEALSSVTGGYPYLIQLLCGQLVTQRNEQRRNEMTPDDVQTAVETLLETPQPGFFWESLTSCQQAVLIAACSLWQRDQRINAPRVSAQLQGMGVPCQHWATPAHQLLHELALEELLRERAGDGQYLEYTLTFELLSHWVRRHKTLDQIQIGEETGNDREPLRPSR